MRGSLPRGRLRWQRARRQRPRARGKAARRERGVIASPATVVSFAFAAFARAPRRARNPPTRARTVVAQRAARSSRVGRRDRERRPTVTFDVYDCSLSLIRSLVPLLERLAGLDAKLADQLRRAAQSITLNVAEANHASAATAATASASPSAARPRSRAASTSRSRSATSASATTPRRTRSSIAFAQ